MVLILLPNSGALLPFLVANANKSAELHFSHCWVEFAEQSWAEKAQASVGSMWGGVILQGALGSKGLVSGFQALCVVVGLNTTGLALGCLR